MSDGASQLEPRPETLLRVARANDAGGGAYHEPFHQVPQSSVVSRFALVCPGKTKAKVCGLQREEGFQATILALMSSPKPLTLPPLDNGTFRSDP